MKKTMTKILLLFSIVIIGLFTTNCKKDEPIKQTEVSFDINSVMQNGLKSTNSDTIICSQLTSDYVMYKIDNGPLTRIDVFYVDNKPYTNSIKLNEGTHTIQEFLVYSDNNTPNISTDDVLLMAAPHSSSVFAGYVTTPLDQTFTTTVDKKLNFKMDVVCFEPMNYNKFGFIYYFLNELTIRQLWFFGDFCIKDKSQYTGSHYALQSDWTGSGYGDVPAISKVEVWRNGTLQNTFTNDNVEHQYGNKFSVTYGDYKQQTDAFEIKLFILVKQGTQYNFVQFKSWTFNDISNISQGSDGVIDYVLGNCYDPLNPPDLLLAPWMNLPSTLTYKMTKYGEVAYGGSGSILGGYIDATLSNIPSGYDISNGNYQSNCADHVAVIYQNQLYTMNVYSSLYPETLPTFAQSSKWEKINWIYNHRDWWPNVQWYDIQGAIWLYDNPAWNGNTLDGLRGLSLQTQYNGQPLAYKIKSDADTYGVGYKVPPGGYATIIFIKDANVQTMFIKIDP